MTDDKRRIIELFINNVKGKTVITDNVNQKHCGKDGHWLEQQMGVKANGNNAPDLYNYEMKNQTSSGKITFGDWSADEYIFTNERKTKINDTNKDYIISRKEFLSFFGKPNPDKKGRLSWSGIPCPTYFGQYSLFGQLLTHDNNENIIITYNYSKDTRSDKSNIIPKNMQKENLVIAKWNKDSIKKKLEDKFNQSGWFTCKKDTEGKYISIDFGEPMNYNSWFKLFKSHIVFFDSGMYDGNNRPYSMWRAKTSYWDSLIIESYK